MNLIGGGGNQGSNSSSFRTIAVGEVMNHDAYPDTVDYDYLYNIDTVIKTTPYMISNVIVKHPPHWFQYMGNHYILQVTFCFEIFPIYFSIFT